MANERYFEKATILIDRARNRENLSSNLHINYRSIREGYKHLPPDLIARPLLSTLVKIFAARDELETVKKTDDKNAADALRDSLNEMRKAIPTGRDSDENLAISLIIKQAHDLAEALRTKRVKSHFLVASEMLQTIIDNKKLSQDLARLLPYNLLI